LQSNERNNDDWMNEWILIKTSFNESD
jgi:hypothetical protein